MPDLNQLNEAQRQAVMHGEGPMLVLAGPGSGKTHVITNRICYLIQHWKTDPSRILVITFTKEAARNMQDRFLAMNQNADGVMFGTFHGIFYQIVKAHSSYRTGAILTTAEKKQLCIPILRNIIQTTQDLQPDEVMWEETLTKCLLAISYYKNTMNMEKASAILEEPLCKYFPKIFRQYEMKREGNKTMDFDDMLYLCYDLLRKNPEICKTWQKKFQFIMIDEFQDINPLQYQIVRLLAAPENHIFAVGDDDQSIYGFRGSDPSLMKRFAEDYPGCKQVLLGTNYRSGKEIVETSVRIISENQNRFPKELFAREECGNSCVSILSFETQAIQYEQILKGIKHFASKEEKESCAVLFRTNQQMQRFAAELQKQKIPYEMKEKAKCIYDHFMMQDISAYIKFARGEKKRSLFFEIMNKPDRRLFRDAAWEETIDFREMEKYYITNGSIMQGKEQKRCLQSEKALKKLETDLDRLASYSPYLGMLYLRKAIGYEQYVKHKAGNNELQKEEWLELLCFFTEEAKGFASYEDWLNHQESIRKQMAQIKERSFEAGKKEKGIYLMTAHASKGLEFDHVWIPDVNEGIYPYGRMLTQDALEEERRVFYVAMTRAKKNLVLSYVTGTKDRPRFPSVFLKSLIPHLQARQIRNCQDTRQMHLPQLHIHHRHQ